MKKYILILILLINTAYSIEYDIVINPFRAGDMADINTANIESIAQNVFSRSKIFNVLDRGNIQFILKEQGYQMAGLTESQDDDQIGQLKNAGFLLTGEISKVGRKYYLNMSIIEIKSAEVVYADTLKIRNIKKADWHINEYLKKAEKVFKDKYLFSSWMNWKNYQNLMLANFSKRIYPRIVEGRTIQGKSEYRAYFIEFPPGYFYYYTLHGMDKTRYLKWKNTWEAQGFKNIQLQTFKDASGVDNYQGTWILLSNK